MRTFSGCITGRLLLKEAPDHGGLLLPPVEMTAHTAHELATVGRAALPRVVGFDARVGQLIAVELRIAARHPDEPLPVLLSAPVINVP